MSNIGIVIIATNAYFVLGIRFIKKFMRHYKGNQKITFYFYSDTNPFEYLPDDINVVFIPEVHLNWVDGTNSKFKNIINLSVTDVDYIYYFDADTNITKDFTEEWFLGDLVGGEHYGNRNFLKDGQGFDRYPPSKAYVPLDSPLPYTYHYGAFFGGKKERVIDFCKTLRDWQIEDKKIPYEPGVNDESYINAYFHYNPPTLTVPTENFMFDISDKGGIGETRNTSLDVENIKRQLLEGKDKMFDIRHNTVVWL
jgi:hypothetical protein